MFFEPGGATLKDAESPYNFVSMYEPSSEKNHKTSFLWEGLFVSFGSKICQKNVCFLQKILLRRTSQEGRGDLSPKT